MRRRINLLPGCSEEDRGDRGFRESQGGILCPSGGGLKIGRLPSPSGRLAAVDGLSAGVKRDKQALEGDVTAERVGMLLGCEGKTAICT